jgi:DNA polymerase III epsilon subunit-like protein
VAKYEVFAPSPSPSRHLPKRRAVALDCEMAGVQGGSSELILVCMVDFFSGESLVNTLVQPTVRVVNWRTRYSGVTRKQMDAAAAQGNTLNGWRAARAALWEHIDADTILVGQSLQHDLDVLRMIHSRVVDAGILARNAVGPISTRQWGLKTLCQEFLDIEIQNSKKGHDCMEDTLAAREVVLWCIERPQELAAWALVKEEEQRRQREQLELARKKRVAFKEAKEKIMEREKTQKESLRTAGPNKDDAAQKTTEGVDYEYPIGGDGDEDEDEDEVLHWSDIAEDFGWPHPDTGYDPWSD